MLTSIAPGALIELATLLTAALVAGGYAAFLTVWITPRIRPEVPQASWPVVALLSMGLTATLAYFAGPSNSFGVLAALTPILLLSAYVDARTKRLPNAYTLQAVMVTLAAVVWLLLEGLDWTMVAWSAAIAGLTFVVLLAANVFSRGGLGMGDVKLAPAMAAGLTLLASSAWAERDVLAAPLMLGLLVIGWLLTSFVLGAVFVAARALRARASGAAIVDKSFPFGPFMIVAWFAAAPVAPLLPQLFM